MNKKPYDDSNWREEYKAYTSSKYHLELLENGPKSLSQSYVMGYLYQKWKRLRELKMILILTAVRPIWNGSQESINYQPTKKTNAMDRIQTTRN